MTTSARTAGGATPVRLLLVGESLTGALQTAPGSLSGITPVASYGSLVDFEAGAGKEQAEILMIEQPTLHDDSAARMLQWMARASAAHAVVVYRYASTDALLRLPASKCSALRAPVYAATLRAHCLAMRRACGRTPAPGPAGVAAITQAAPSGCSRSCSTTQ